MRLTAFSVSLFITGIVLVSAGPAAAQQATANTYSLGALAISTHSDIKHSNNENLATTEDSNENSKETEKEVFVTVKKGDSLSKIAKKHKTTFKRLYDANTSIKHPDMINPGDKIRIPHKDEELKSRKLPTQPKAVTRVAPKATPKQATVTQAPNVAGGSVWDRLAQCESGGNWSINTGNGYYGGLQFTLSTWRSVGGSGYPHQNSREEQIKRGQILQARSGWGQWPACASKLGLL